MFGCDFMMDIEQSQRRDIDNIQNDKISLTIDNYNIIDSPLNKNLYNFMVDGYNWIKNDNKIFKYNLVENDKLVFHIDKVDELFEKIITNIKISFEIENGDNNFIFNGVNLIHDDIIKNVSFNEFMNKREMVFNCGTFNYDDLDFIVNGKEFDIELLFDGNKSNSLFSLKNIYMIFEFVDKLTNESNTVVNRLEPQIDFYRDENGDLILQIGGDASGKGIDRSSIIDTYSKSEIDNKLATKVDIEIGKGLSSQDYSLQDKLKLMDIENNANNYVHPASHSSSIIKENSTLTNLETSENATQHEINLAIDNKIGNVGSDVDWDNIVNKPDDFPPSVHNHDDRYYTESEVDTALNNKQDNLISGTNLKTINNNSLLGSGNITIQGGGTGVDIATSWGDPTSDSKVPSEKLTKDSLDGKANSVHSHGGITSDGKWNGTGGRGFLIVDNTTKDISAVQYVNATVVRDTQTFTNITPSIDTQKGINTAIDTALSNIPSNADIIDLIYPVGSIYMSINSTSPQTLFGGTWQQLTDTFLYASTTADTNSTTATGGEATHTLTTNEMPSHSHTISIRNVYNSNGTANGGFGYNASYTQQATSNVGGGQAHNNMPPYMKVYMWKRTA